MKLIALISVITFIIGASCSPYVVTYEEGAQIEPNSHRHLLGAKKCTYGPSYWCHNITQAKECGAIKHCIKKVWEPMKLPADNDSICDICKEMVKEARDTLLSNETQDELRQVLEGSCNLIPIKLISEECDRLADEFIPELIETLASRMDPQVVCSVSGLCNSVRIDEMLGEFKIIDSSENGNKINLKSDSDSCPKCTQYMTTTLSQIKSLSKDDLKTKLYEVCGQLGSFSDSCRGIVDVEIETIYYQIQKLNPTEICGLIGLCEVVSFHPVKLQSSPVSSVRVWSPPKNEQDKTDYQCNFCKQLVAYLRGWFTTDTTKEEFKQIIKGLCKQTGKYRQECVNLADEYGGMIYELITDELDPNKACVFIEQCPSTYSNLHRITLFNSASHPRPIWTLLKNPSVENPLIKLIPSEKLTGNDEVYPLTKLTAAEKLIGTDELDRNRKIVAKKGHKDILPTCALCSFTITKLIDLIGRNRSKAAIDSAVDEVCYLIPGSYKEKCLVFMEEYGEKVAEMILIEGTAHEICTALHLCLFSPNYGKMHEKNIGNRFSGALPPSRYMPQILARERVGEMKKVVGEKPTCPLCEFVMTQLDSMLKNNATEEEIKDTVEHICDYLPKTIKSQCRDFIEEYGDVVISYLSQELDPKEICTKISLCSSSHTTQLHVMNLSKLSRCELCILITDYLSAFLEDPSVDVSIEKLVEHICPLLPKTKEPECREMIEDYGPYLISLIAQATQKGKACEAVNLCPQKKSTTDSSSMPMI